MRPTDAKAVDHADVYKGNRVAGSLRRTDDGIVFDYEASYVENDGTAVAYTLPPSGAPYRTTAGAVPAFFAGLLPEGARLLAVVAAVKTSPDDELSLLVAVGEDTVGDVRIVEHGAEPSPPSLSLPTTPSETSFGELFNTSIDPATAQLDRAVPGVQPKLSDASVSFPISGGEGPSILKLTPPSFALIVENEAFFLGLARTGGLAVPNFELIADREGATGLLVERFDRVGFNGDISRIAQEDACQLLNRWPADKYRITVNDIASRLGDVASAPVVSILNLVKQVAFSWIIGNGDMHAKNFSMQWFEDEQLVVPTPAYGLVSTLPYPLNQHMAMQLDGRDANLRGRFLVEFAEQFGVTRKLARRGLEELAERVAPGVGDVSQIGYDERTTERLATEIDRRINILCRFD